MKRQKQLQGTPAIFCTVRKHIYKGKYTDAMLILDWVNHELLPPNYQMEFYYLRGRINLLKYRFSKNIKDLILADESSDALFDVSRKSASLMVSGRQMFNYIYTKYLIAKDHPCMKRKGEAKRLIDHVLPYALSSFKGNSSIKWVSSKLNPFGVLPNRINLNAYWK